MCVYIYIYIYIYIYQAPPRLPAGRRPAGLGGSPRILIVRIIKVILVIIKK